MQSVSLFKVRRSKTSVNYALFELREDCRGKKKETIDEGELQGRRGEEK